jgi:hypothetical protein
MHIIRSYETAVVQFAAYPEEAFVKFQDSFKAKTFLGFAATFSFTYTDTTLQSLKLLDN